MIWKRKRLFTNDLLELKQAKIEINSLEATVDNDVKFKSSKLFDLDEKLEIPFGLVIDFNEVIRF